MGLRRLVIFPCRIGKGWYHVCRAMKSRTDARRCFCSKSVEGVEYDNPLIASDDKRTAELLEPSEISGETAIGLDHTVLTQTMRRCKILIRST